MHISGREHLNESSAQELPHFHVQFTLEVLTSKDVFCVQLSCEERGTSLLGLANCPSIELNQMFVARIAQLSARLRALRVLGLEHVHEKLGHLSNAVLGVRGRDKLQSNLLCDERIHRHLGHDPDHFRFSRLRGGVVFELLFELALVENERKAGLETGQITSDRQAMTVFRMHSKKRLENVLRGRPTFPAVRDAVLVLAERKVGHVPDRRAHAAREVDKFVPIHLAWGQCVLFKQILKLGHLV